MQLSILFNDPSRRALALDLSGMQLRFASFRQARRRVELTHYGSSALPEGAIHDGDVGNAKLLSEAVRRLLADTTKRAHTRNVFVAIPDRHVYLKHMDVPAGDQQHLDEAIRWEATQHIPYDLRELTIDWAMLRRTNITKPEAVLLAAPQSVIVNFTNVIERAGATPIAIEPASLSILRGYVDQVPPEGTHLLVHLGEQESIAIILEQRIPLFTASIPFTIRGLETSLGRNFNLTDSDANRALRLLGLEKRRARGVVRSSLEQHLKAFAKRIDEIVSYHRDHMQLDKPIDRIILTGPGMLVAGISEAFNERLNRDPVRTHPPAQLTLTHRVADFERLAAEYAVTIGLGLRILERYHV